MNMTNPRQVVQLSSMYILFCRGQNWRVQIQNLRCTHSNVFSDLLYFQKHTVASSAVDIRYRASPLARGQNYKQKIHISTVNNKDMRGQL